MNDTEIISLFWSRSERAIAESKAKYGGYCLTIARNILGSAQDAEESVLDTWLAAWNSIPPQRPAILRSYLGKLADCIADGSDVESEIDQRMLVQSVNRFLAGLKESERKVFVCRYWYLDSVSDISARFGFSESKVKSMLLRLRKRLKTQLEREGYFDEN